MIAGLVAPDRGRIRYRGKVLFDAAGKVNLPPYRRQFGYVFQDGRLFPHLTVRGNLEYGRRMYRLRRDPAELERVVAMLDIGHLLHRRPGKLAGPAMQEMADVEHGDNALEFCRIAPEPVHASPVFEIAAHGQVGKQPAVLKHVTELPAIRWQVHLSGGVEQDLAAIHDAPAVGRDEAGDHVDETRLAGARGSEQGGDAALALEPGREQELAEPLLHVERKQGSISGQG